jgi:hypothetical protein
MFNFSAKFYGLNIVLLKTACKVSFPFSGMSRKTPVPDLTKIRPLPLLDHSQKPNAAAQDSVF